MISRNTVPLWRFLGDISLPGPDGDLTPQLGKKAIGLLAFLAPISYVLFGHREQIQEMTKIDPNTVRGKVLFFTAPG